MEYQSPKDKELGNYSGLQFSKNLGQNRIQNELYKNYKMNRKKYTKEKERTILIGL